MALIKAFTKSDTPAYSQILGNNYSGLLTKVIITNNGDVESESSVFVVNGMNYFTGKIPPKDTKVINLDCLLTNEDLTFSAANADVFVCINILEK